jgi:ABC-type glycerol-3-phosphate transport system substrate-binding protein
MKNMSKFQLILTGVFALFILIGVVVFASGRISSSTKSATVLMWGTLAPDVFEQVKTKAGFSNNNAVKIVYVQKSEDNFDRDFIEALASGQGPDIFFLPQYSILKHQDKVFEIPFDSVSVRDFRNIFIEEGELYVTETGVTALPFMVDPMVMYWNRSIFNNAGMSLPPKFWSEFYTLAPKLTVKDSALNVTQSAVALGEYANINHSDDIVSLLNMQAGGSLSRRSQGKVESVLNVGADDTISPASAALIFFTEFVNPVKPHYSWNRSLQSSKNAFTFGDLATYFGYASELFDIQRKNPNLNFDVAKIPQSLESQYALTFGNMNALAITKASANKSAALLVVLGLVQQESIRELTLLTRLPPVRRDLLAERQNDNYLAVFYESAIQARSWLTPEKADTRAIFKEMIESVTSGRKSVTEAVFRASAELEVAFEKIQN